MKFLLSILLIVPLFTSAQRFALIDRKLKIPILYTDSITVEQVKQGFIPVENKSIDTLIANIKYLIGIMEVRQRSKMQSFELKSSNVTIKTARTPFAYGDRYNSLMETHSNGVIAQYNIIDPTITNKKSVERLEKMIAYFKSNKSFFTYPYEISPKVYNVVVIVE